MVAFFFEIILNSIPNSYKLYSLTAFNNSSTIKYFQNHYKFFTNLIYGNTDICMKNIVIKPDHVKSNLFNEHWHKVSKLLHKCHKCVLILTTCLHHKLLNVVVFEYLFAIHFNLFATLYRSKYSSFLRIWTP